MIGYSIVSDNAYAPEQSNSIYISKTNQKSSISYIPTLRHYRKKNFRNKPLDQYGVSIISEDSSLLQFTLYQHILRYGVCRFKNQRNPIPKHVELQTISTYSNQWPTEHLLNFDTNIWSYRRTWLSENTLKFLIGSWQKQMLEYVRTKVEEEY